MGKLSCLFPFSRRNKTSVPKDMGEDVRPRSRIDHLNDEVEKLGLVDGSVNTYSSWSKAMLVSNSKVSNLNVLDKSSDMMPVSTLTVPNPDVLDKSSDILQQNIEIQSSDMYGCRNETELASGSGSENESLAAMQSGEVEIHVPGELADDESEKGLDVCDLESCRSLAEDKCMSKEADSDLVGPWVPEDAFHFEKFIHEDIFSLSQAAAAADFTGDYDCVRTSYNEQLSGSTTVFPANKGSERTISDDEILTGHTSDPGVYKTGVLSLWNSPLSHGICTGFSPEGGINVTSPEASSIYQKGFTFGFHSVPNLTNLDFDESVQIIPQMTNDNTRSKYTFHSAGKVILKAEASSDVQPVIRRKPWWRIFVLSHRNIHKKGSYLGTSATLPDGQVDERLTNLILGYTSDICDDNGRFISEFTGSAADAGQFTDSREKANAPSAGERSYGLEEPEPCYSESQVGLSRQNAPSGSTILWPSKKWRLVSSENADLKRVEDWVSNIEPGTLPPDDAFKDGSSSLQSNNSLEIESQIDPDLTAKDSGVLTADAEIAKAIVRSLNTFSTVANISGIGLKLVPPLGMFNSLRTLNMSANCIVRITPGSLPRSLHSLDLSRNRIAVVEGLRDLTRLRVLNLSYNRISRIGHGLANCTLIKELYLAGNKISDVEGLHRLLKLSVLDLSFNKLTTSKSLGQLAANYSSLLALNLLGNPVHVNLGEEQLRKLVISLVPHLTYLNKQPIKAVSAREVVVDSVARAALGSPHRANKSSGSRGSRRGGGSQSISAQSRLSGHHVKRVDRRHGLSRTLGASELDKQKHRHASNQGFEKGIIKEHRKSNRIAPFAIHEQQLRRQFMGLSQEGMSRSKSEGTLCDKS